ncbi:MAG: isoprenyl transferase [Bacteroidales bacterium]|jgi:undecaprenyl diphosphate synthase|nr:isoprenyl transferase [Bacteroidales bacterium]
MISKESIQGGPVPKHVAVIMDGNGRWARQRGLSRVLGHRNGVQAVRETLEAASEAGVSYLTLYAFSTENWNRPAEEVSALMSLLVQTIDKETDTLMQHGIRLLTVGGIEALPAEARNALIALREKTSVNTGPTLILALNYSGKWDITQAARRLAGDVRSGVLDVADIDEQCFAGYLSTQGIPDPELMIRTSGECRLSNFLLWQLAYAEFYFTPVLWPDFRKEHFFEAIADFQHRERRFGRIDAQIS